MDEGSESLAPSGSGSGRAGHTLPGRAGRFHWRQGPPTGARARPPAPGPAHRRQGPPTPRLSPHSHAEARHRPEMQRNASRSPNPVPRVRNRGAEGVGPWPEAGQEPAERGRPDPLVLSPFTWLPLAVFELGQVRGNGPGKAPCVLP